MGVDCIHFIENICLESGIMSEIIPAPAYSPTWYNTRENAIIEAIEEYIAKKLCPGVLVARSEKDKTGKPGDLLCMKINSPVVNHVAVKLWGNEIIHASTRAKRVVVESLEAYQKFINCVYSWGSVSSWGTL